LGPSMAVTERRALPKYRLLTSVMLAAGLSACGIGAMQARRQCPAEWWGLRVDLRCLRAAVDRGVVSVSLVGLSWAMGGRHQIGH